MPTQPDRPTELFAEYVRRTEGGEPLDFESFCQDHPEHAEALHKLKEDWERIQGVLENLGPSGTLSERIKTKYGSEADPNITLDDEGSSSDLATELIDRLGSRGEGYGRYRLKGEIDRGGQGAVLRVWDEDLRRNLAMKIMLGQVEMEATGETPPVDSKTLGRFLEEAQVTGQLDHPGIVPVHELGLDAEGRVYFTMKLVKGESLKQVFEKVKTGEDGWTRTRVLGVLLKVCEAMAYAHDKGVIHRDLKPANIMVGRFGEVYVMDWGLARVMEGEDKKDIRIKPAETSVSEVMSERREHGDTPGSPLITMDGDVVGTPAYMSPEQARGELDQMGPWSDVYSIGAIIYELLAGHMPYVKEGVVLNNYAVWSRVQEGPPHALSDSRSIPKRLIAVYEKAIARARVDRYESVSALAADLRGFLEGGALVAYQPSRIEKAGLMWTSQGRLGKLGSIAGVVALGLTPFALTNDEGWLPATMILLWFALVLAGAAFLLGQAILAPRRWFVVFETLPLLGAAVLAWDYAFATSGFSYATSFDIEVERLYEKGDYHSAIARIESIPVARRGYNDEFYLALSFWSLDEWQPAIAALQAMEDSEFASTSVAARNEIQHWEARIYLEMGEHEKAMEVLSPEYLWPRREIWWEE